MLDLLDQRKREEMNFKDVISHQDGRQGSQQVIVSQCLSSTKHQYRL